MKKTLILFLYAIPVLAGLPPTTSKLNGESVYPTTFKFNLSNFNGTRSGTTLNLGTLLPSGGGTGVSSSGANGNILQSNGTSWLSVAPDFSNRALSNLSGVSINQSLVGDTTSIYDLGLLSAKWKNGFFSSYVMASSLVDVNAVISVDSNNRLLKNTSNTTLIDFSGTAINLQSKVVNGLADPVVPTDVSNKNYVDSVATTKRDNLTWAINSSFEKSFTGSWTNSGGTLSQQAYSSQMPSVNELFYARFVASASGQYVQDFGVTTPSYISGGCEFDVGRYNTASNLNFVIKVLDGALNILGSQTLTSSAWLKSPSVYFLCPAEGQALNIRIESLGAGTIEFDNIHLGQIKNTASAVCQGTTECEDVFSAQVDSTGIISSENLDFINSSCTASSGQFNCPLNANIFTQKLNCTASDNSAGASVFIDYDQLNSTSSNLRFYAYNSITNTPVNHPFSIICQKQGADFVKAKPQIAVTNEQNEWLIDANIGGANPTLGTVAVSAYAQITNPNLDLVLNPGSSAAEISCASGTASTGSTCSSDEDIGIAFFPKETGKHEACFSFEAISGTNSEHTFQLIETTNTSSVIVSEGNTRNGFAGTAGNQAYGTFRLCGIFNFTDLSKKTLRLEYEQTASTLATPQIIADRNSTLGQRDIHIEVRNITANRNRPVLVSNQVIQNGSSNAKLFSAKVTTTSGVVSNNKGSIITGCTAANPTVCTFVGLTTTPNCTTSPDGLSIAAITQNAASATSISIQSVNAATGTPTASQDFRISCVGE